MDNLNEQVTNETAGDAVKSSVEQGQSANSRFNDDFFKNGQRKPVTLKSKLLFVVSIILIVFSGIGLITNIFSLTPGALATTRLAYESMGIPTDVMDKIMKILPFTIYFNVFIVLFQILSGVLGILFSNKKDKGSIIIILGCIQIGLVFLNTLVVGSAVTKMISPYMPTGGFLGGAMMIGLISGLVIPVLYIIGGIKLGKLQTVIE